MARFGKKKDYYQKVYRSAAPRRHVGPIRAAMTVVVVLALAVLGWGLYDPVYNLIMGNYTIFEPAERSQSSDASSPAPSTPEQPPDDAVEEPPAEPQQALSAVYMPEQVLLSASARAAFIAGLDNTQYNAVMFDLKNTAGTVNYRSALPEVAACKALSPAAVDLAELTAQLADRGFTALGRVHSFRDPLAAKGLGDAMVKYNNTDWTWLDNSPELGGRPWLNPFSAEAHDYIEAIALEAVGMGVGHIVLDSVHFPVGFSLEVATYGRLATDTQKHAQLRNFVTQVTAAVEERGAKLSLYIPVTSVLGVDQERYAGNPADLSKQSVLLGVMPSLFGNAFMGEELMLEAPVLNPYQTVKKALDNARAKLAAGDVTVMVQAYTATNIDPLYNRVYTRQDVDEQLRAAADAGFAGTMLYDPQGSY